MQRPRSRNSSDIGVIMKPEGSMKICVLNGSRQVDKVVGGEWQTRRRGGGLRQRHLSAFRRSRHPERLSAFPCRTSATLTIADLPAVSEKA